MINKQRLRRDAVIILATVVVAAAVVWFSKRPRTVWYAQDVATGETFDILFVGNSLTYYHDMPGIVAEMYRDRHPDQRLKIAAVTGPGFKLSQHIHHGDALKMIHKDGPWDWIILQEHGGLTYSDPDEAARSLKTFAEASRQAGARPIVYLDWHSAAVPNHESLLEKIAAELQLPCIPVAQAWHKSREIHPEIELLMDDGVHPTAAGSYLIALVIYSYLSDEDPTNLPAEGVEEAIASQLQEVVREAMQ